MSALATGRSQLPVAGGCSQERGSTSRCLHRHPQSLSPLLFLHPASPLLSFLFHCHPITKPSPARDENPGAGCR